MILINGPQKIKVLKHQIYSGEKTFQLIYSLNNDEVTINTAVDEKYHYYEVEIPVLTEGEYIYNIICDDNIIETGLLFYGEINKSQNSNNTYIYE